MPRDSSRGVVSFLTDLARGVVAAVVREWMLGSFLWMCRGQLLECTRSPIGVVGCHTATNHNRYMKVLGTRCSLPPRLAYTNILWGTYGELYPRRADRENSGGGVSNGR